MQPCHCKWKRGTFLNLQTCSLHEEYFSACYFVIHTVGGCLQRACYWSWKDIEKGCLNIGTEWWRKICHKNRQLRKSWKGNHNILFCFWLVLLTGLQNLLVPVFENGVLLRDYTLDEVRERAELPLVLSARRWSVIVSFTYFDNDWTGLDWTVFGAISSPLCV